MTTVEFIDHLTTIFLDITVPIIFLWISYKLNVWLGKGDKQ